jgi:hypothetical protein
MAHGSCLYNVKSGKAEAPTSYAKEVQRFEVCMPQECQCTIGLVVGQTQSHKTQACMNPREIDASTTFLQISRGIQVHARTQRSISHCSISINMEQTRRPEAHLHYICRQVNFTRHKHIISVDISDRYICTSSVLLHLPRSTPSSSRQQIFHVHTLRVLQSADSLTPCPPPPCSLTMATFASADR